MSEEKEDDLIHVAIADLGNRIVGVTNAMFAPTMVGGVDRSPYKDLADGVKTEALLESALQIIGQVVAMMLVEQTDPAKQEKILEIMNLRMRRHAEGYLQAFFEAKEKP